MMTVKRDNADSSPSGRSASASLTAAYGKEDYTYRYWESTQETLVGLYGKRDALGQPIETVNEIVHRVSTSVAVAELKYALTPEELVELSLDEALQHPTVVQFAQIFADNIGNQRFWANTPANINADPETSLKVLQYWANGKLAGLKEDDIWLRSEDLRSNVIQAKLAHLNENEVAMGHLSAWLRGKGCLAACGVAFVVRLPGRHPGSRPHRSSGSQSCYGHGSQYIQPAPLVISDRQWCRRFRSGSFLRKDNRQSS